ncbi:MAG: hypothetical protein AVDCRST_MAG44-204 [uncultured Sphingomonas sp.]|uniref:TonB C-terminal domain-containing protein n=1 Tax=uncultured Sphingomonas sp. TaxID=158754 RepID=A0A6J4SB62_9SPHN|nr:MAG: hypothetical protein AVDCRST_MAG44-204 [uncultured Sphingomonas sp.]
MTERFALACGLWLLPLLASCGGTDSAADDTVTATLPAAEGSVQPPSDRGGSAKTRTIPAPIAASTYTSLEPAACKLIEENSEEGGYSRRRCPGVAGYRLETSESDLRQNVVVIAPDGRRSELDLSGLVAKGAFNRLGKAAEWRGDSPAGPTSLIFRLHVAAYPEARRPDVGKLVVARLVPSACIAAIVPPGPGQNDKARAIAEGKLPNCMGE